MRLLCRASEPSSIATRVAIEHIDLTRIDLNLLVALDALLDERSVTRAAARVGIGQSAMSSSLARLRRLFDDELLTRAPDGMRPTPRALKIAEPLRCRMSALSQASSSLKRGLAHSVLMPGCSSAGSRG